MNSLPEQMVRRFLLGISTEDEVCRVEDAILTGTLDESFLRDAEDELIDDYLVGSLVGEEGRGFTVHFLSAEGRRQKLSFASSLIEYARKQPVEELPAGQKINPHSSMRILLPRNRTALLALAASLLIVALIGFDQVRLRRQAQIASAERNELTRMRAALATGDSDSSQLDKPLTAPPSINTRDAVHQMPVLVFASSTRSVYPALLHIPSEAQFVRIELKLPLPLAGKYRAVVFARNGEQLWAQEFPASILPASNAISVVLPASVLLPGLYHFQLEDASSEGKYQESADWVFRIVKE